MNRSFFIFIGVLIYAATMTSCSSQMTITATDQTQSSVVDSNSDSNLEIRKMALSRVSDQRVFGKIAIDIKDNIEIRKMALARVSDQRVFGQIAMNTTDSLEIRKMAQQRQE